MGDPVEVERLRTALASVVLVADTAILDAPVPLPQAEAVADALIAAGVWLPREGAVLEEGVAVAMEAVESSPWPAAIIEGDGLVTWYGHDITTAYWAWVHRQPQTAYRTYSWAVPLRLCPECVAGKHGACSDLAADGEPDTCQCQHQEE